MTLPRSRAHARGVLGWLLLFLPPLLWPNPARAAWLETRVVSDVATVEFEGAGHARVTHEMLLRVRGGPLKRFVLAGLDATLTPEPGASLVLAKSGRRAGIPIALRMQPEAEGLTLELVYEKGVGSGSYLVSFAYRTDLEGQNALEQRGDHQVLSFASPRFEHGIGSLKARFVVPRAEPPPSLWSPTHESDPASAALDLLATEEGVFLSELRREATRDVLELTRPHVARGEQVTWRVRLPKVMTTSHAVAAPPEAETRKPARVPGRGARATAIWLAAGLGGACLAFLVWCKRRWLVRIASNDASRVGFLVPLPVAIRFLAIAAGVALAVGLTFWFERATAACATLGIVMLLSIQHARPERVAPRGPGRWRVVDPDDALVGTRRLRGAGVLLEASTGPGLLVFATLALVAAVFALRGMTEAPYRSAALVAALAGLSPLFVTLGGARLALPRALLETSALEPYYSLFRKRRQPIELIARHVDGGDTSDEHRVRLLVSRPLAGFDSLELGLEWHHGGWFLAVRPVFIARVREGSLAHLALPRDAHWSRGRQRDERIALIRPAASPAACLAKARELRERLTQPLGRSAKRARENARAESARRSTAAVTLAATSHTSRVG